MSMPKIFRMATKEKSSQSRRERTIFSDAQLKELEAYFQLDKYPDYEAKYRLGKRLNLGEDKIQIWFKNRRAKLRREEREETLSSNSCLPVQRAHARNTQLYTDTNRASRYAAYGPIDIYERFDAPLDIARFDSGNPDSSAFDLSSAYKTTQGGYDMAAYNSMYLPPGTEPDFPAGAAEMMHYYCPAGDRNREFMMAAATSHDHFVQESSHIKEQQCQQQWNEVFKLVDQQQHMLTMDNREFYHHHQPPNKFQDHPAPDYLRQESANPAVRNRVMHQDPFSPAAFPPGNRHHYGHQRYDDSL